MARSEGCRELKTVQRDYCLEKGDKMKIWRKINIAWLVLFIIGVIFISVRKVDGSGVVQTPQIRMISLAVLGVFFIFICLCQLVVLYFVKRRG